MTYIRSTVLPNGDVKEIRTNPGAAPQVYINGVRQPMREPTNTNPWERWFAWRPVQDKHGSWQFGKMIYRRRLPDPIVYNDYEYGTIFDLLKN